LERSAGTIKPREEAAARMKLLLLGLQSSGGCSRKFRDEP
jgi:hypothetical protein